MFVGAYFLSAVANLLNLIIIVYIWLIVARALLSWVTPDPYNPIVRFLYRATEPVLRPVRHRLPTLAMGLDLPPMVVILALYFLKEFLVPVLHRLAMTLEIGWDLEGSDAPEPPRHPAAPIPAPIVPRP